MFLTTLEIFRDNTGVLRYENVSWPVYKMLSDQSGWSVKDIDDSYFIIPKEKAVETDRPSRLENSSFEDYMIKRLTPEIVDFHKAYKEFFGIDVKLNEKAQYQYHAISDEQKKKLINESDKSTKALPIKKWRNLFIQPDDI